METLDEILTPDRSRRPVDNTTGVSGPNGGNDQAVRPQFSATEKTTTPPTTQAESSVRGRSRLNPNGNLSAPESGGEKSLSATTTQQAVAPAVPEPPKTLDELRKSIDQYTPPTPEELEKEKKKQKRAKMFAAIGDGLAALSNLYFTSQGAPNMYDGKNSLLESTKVSYDKMLKDREDKRKEYFNSYIKMKELENAERSWQRQLGLDQKADDRYNQEQADKKAREDKEDERWQKTFDENKRRADRSHDFQVEQHDDNVALRRELAAATSAKGVRGKQLGFADGKGNQVSIYENVWKGSMQQVYDAMLQDLAPADEAERKRWERQMKKLDTAQKKEDYVKQNWHRSPKASLIMLTLSGIDPANMTSELNDDVEDYTPGGGDDEVIDYTPGKK